MDIVLQGPANTFTNEIAEHYLQLEFVNTIIISCWKGDHIETVNPRIKLIVSDDIENPGLGNRNRHIYSSLIGLEQVTTPFSVKMRSDQKVSLEGMRLMYSFYENHKERQLSFHDNPERPYNQICVAGIFPSFPFHPRDHTYWGNTHDLIDVFSIPFDLTSNLGEYIYTKWLRSEAYIASHYYSKFDSRVSNFIENYSEYLIDNAPRIKEAFEVNDAIIIKVFLPFPKVEFAWPKYEFYTHNNYYEYTEKTYGEYWSPLDNS